MKTAKTVALVSLILSGTVAIYSLHTIATTDATVRKEETVRSLRDAGVSEEHIDKKEPFIW